jgi:hypothetical protein
LNYAALQGQKRELGLVTVATYWDVWEANLALGKLRSEGIDATLADQNIVSSGGGFYANLTGGIKLQVAVGDAERARAALPRRSTPAPIKCPKCGSDQTRVLPQNTIVRMLCILLLGIPYVLFGRRWTCTACGNTWRRSIYDEPEDRQSDDDRQQEENDDSETQPPDVESPAR